MNITTAIHKNRIKIIVTVSNTTSPLATSSLVVSDCVGVGVVEEIGIIVLALVVTIVLVSMMTRVTAFDDMKGVTCTNESKNGVNGILKEIHVTDTQYFVKVSLT